MKNKLFITLFVILGFNLQAQKVTEAYKVHSITFLGLDYTAAVFIGSNGFNDPAALKPLTHSWNSLFITEHNKYNVQKWFNVLTTVSLKVVDKRNSQTDFTGRITDKLSELPHLTRSDLTAIISGYPDFTKEGVSLVFIVDAYDKATATAYYHFVFIDNLTKTILLSYPVTGTAGGGGLRNYWANACYEAIIKGGKQFSATAEFYRDYTE
jgi:hypothetical protein